MEVLNQSIVPNKSRCYFFTCFFYLPALLLCAIHFHSVAKHVTLYTLHIAVLQRWFTGICCPVAKHKSGYALDQTYNAEICLAK